MRAPGRITAAMAAALGLALLAGGCNFAKTGKVAADAPDIVTVIPTVSGADTSVTLDRATLGTLNGLGVSLKPTGTAKLSDGVVSFPITSGYAEIHSDHDVKPGWIQGSLDHDGSGLDVVDGATTVALTDFVVDPGGSMLYATVDGKPDVPLLFLDGAKLTTSTNTAGQVVIEGTVASLTSQASAALDQAFHTSAIAAGTVLGSVEVAIQSPAPLPASIDNLAQEGITGYTYNASTDHVTALSRLSGQSTTLTLEPAVVSALTTAHLKVGPTGSATASGAAVTFPITGGFVAIHANRSYEPGYVVGTVLHQGSGITITADSSAIGLDKATISLSDFVVDPGDSVLTGTVNGKIGVPLFFLDGAKLRITPTPGGAILDGTVAELTTEAAGALDKTFGTATFKPGMPVGTVHLVAKG